MKKLFFFFVLFGAFLCQAQVMAQQAYVKGRVFDVANGEALPGASIQCLNQNFGTVSDLQGNFSLPLPHGDYKLNVSYIGYKDTTFQFTLNAQAQKNFSVALESGLAELQELVISGMLQGQARALNQQKSSDNIKNIVAADQIGRFPDPNAAEALQRIPGVNIERDQGEGRYVLIRGLAPQFTNISINGEQIPSPEADVRFVALDVIPSDQLASMEVSKALTPDMDGDAIAGSVNLITRKAESAKPEISASLAGGYNQLMEKGNFQGSLQLGRRYGKQQQLGVLLNSSYYGNHLGSDNLEREPFDNEMELRDYELKRTRLGLSSTIDYRFNERSELYLRVLHSRFSDQEWRRRYVFIPEDEEIEKLTKDRLETQSITTLNLGAKHQLSGFSLDYEAQYSYGEQDTPHDYEGVFIAEIPSSFDFANPKFPGINAESYLNNSSYEFDELGMGNTLAKDRNLTAKFNVGVPYRLGAADGLLKFGAKTRFKRKSYSIVQEIFEAADEVPDLSFFEGGLLDQNFLGGKYQLSSPLNMDKLVNYYRANMSGFELQEEDKAIDEALEAYEAEEEVYAGYIMARHQYKKLMVLGGLRYEKTNVRYQSKDVIIDAEGDLLEIRPVQNENSYDFILPQVHLKYALYPNTILRTALTYSYARPNFIEIVPAQEANLEDNEASVGNPELLPVSALNFDLLAEHYFGNIGIVSGGLFYKRLDDFIYPKVLFNSQYPLAGTPIATNIRVTQAQNGSQADLSGVELALQRNLDFLPGFLSGLNIYANYTYTHSEAEIQSREADENSQEEMETIRLPGQAAHVGNLSIGYQKSKLTARISMNFNGEYLSEVGGSPEEDLYVASRMQLDASASYAIRPRLRVFTEFMNLTNQPFETYFGTKDVIAQREFYSWWSRIGFKFDL